MSTPDRFPSNRFVELFRSGKAPQISVLMPAYRQGASIAAAVDSMLDQRKVVAEIIISDDASGDRTFECALETVRRRLVARGTDHHIVMRRGDVRLWRDHLPLLVEQASCDLVCQAHGDDQSHPLRASLLVRAFRARPDVTMLCSESVNMDPGGSLAWAALAANIALQTYSFPQIIRQRDPHLIGFSQAWRRSVVAGFPQLASSFSAVGHDRILPLRCAMAGKVCLVRSPLVHRGVHGQQASRLMFDEPGIGSFGWNLCRISVIAAMLQDVGSALDSRLIDSETADRLRALMRTENETSLDRMLTAFRTLTAAGRQIAWVDESMLRVIKGMADEARS